MVFELINKIADVSKCSCHSKHTHRAALAYDMDLANDKISVEVIDICDNCGVSCGESYYLRFALEV